ncbi:SMP-30/gluconolactonase/LRE family protein [Hyphococcus sp.]|uniref:SMP-30/gluconolactonase/LRE family protein n=1 Tax=Hyphococcus sp. TaxID=2038636 RepID=UPI0035C6B287
MKMRLFSIAMLAFAAACSAPDPAAPAAEEASTTPKLEQIWIAEGLTAPEGVAAAPQGGYFISNVVGEGGAKDGEGWISILSEDGDIVTEKFAEGLDAPKGMAVHEGRLYVADLDQVRIFNAETGEPAGTIAIDGARFLNDATVWGGAVYVSDSGGASIHKVDGEAATLWLENDRLGGINGLLGDGDTLYISTMESGSLFAADADATLTEIASGMENADGIGLVPGGGWLVSSWPGAIYYVSPEGETTELLDTREAGILQNDLTMFGDLVIVPNWRPGTVTAWKAVR